MITLKLAHYTTKEKEELFEILRTGLHDYTQKCNEKCRFCEHSKPCKAVQSALRYLNRDIISSQKK